MTKNCVYSIPCSLKLEMKRLEEHTKVVVRGEIEKSVMADHIWKEKGNYLPS